MSDNTNRTPYSKKVNEWLISTSGCGLVDFCRKFGYPRRETKIIEELDEEDEAKTKKIIKCDKELISLWRNSSSNDGVNARKGKNRSLTEFFRTLVTGWIVEDLVISMLKQKGLDVSHNGADVQRDIDKANSVSQEPDITVRVGDSIRKVELTCEFNDILNQDGYIEKRAPSLYNLWRRKSVWLYFDLPSGKYILVDFATEPISIMLRWHEYWNKDVHRYTLEDNGKRIRDDRLLSSELISVVGCGIEGKEQPKINEFIDTNSPPHYWDIGGIRKDDTTSRESSNSTRNNSDNIDMSKSVLQREDTKDSIVDVKQIEEVNEKENDYILSDEELGIDGFA